MLYIRVYNCVDFQVRVAGLVTTLVNVTGGHQGATNALATEDGAVDTRNGTMAKVSYYVDNSSTRKQNVPLNIYNCTAQKFLKTRNGNFLSLF